MPPTATCLVAVGAVLAAGTREGGRAMRWHRMEAQENSRTSHPTAVSWHFCIYKKEVGAALHLPSFPVSDVSQILTHLMPGFQWQPPRHRRVE